MSHGKGFQVVTCKNPALRKRIVSVLQMAQTTISSLSSSFRSISYELENEEQTPATKEAKEAPVTKNEKETASDKAVTNVKMES